MSTNSLIRRLMTRPFRSQTTLPIRKPREVGRRIEELEDRSTPTAGLSPADQQLVAAYGQLPLSFEPNQGQTAAQVQYLSQGSGYTLFLTSTGSVLSLQQPVAATDPAVPSTVSTTSTGVALAMNLVGSNPQTTVVGQDQLPGSSNYFIGNNPSQWHTDIASYGKVAYQDVYPGVNLVYYGNQQQLEYDFVVVPGADPGLIRFNVEGAENVSLDGSGNLVLQTATGNVLEHAPVLYQEVGGTQKAVSGQFVLLGATEVGFQVGAYNESLPLVIDPVLSYSTYLGGDGLLNYGYAIALDGSGNAFVTGSTYSTNFPTTTGAFQTTLGGTSTAFVTELNASGTALVYSTYLGGNNDDGGNDIAVDGSGDAYVTGSTSSTNFPTTAGACQTSLGGTQNAFVTKLNASGTALVYSTYLGGNNGDSDIGAAGIGIAVNGSGNAYVTGGTFSTNFPTTTGAFQTTLSGIGTSNAFVTELNANGTALVYSTYLGGNGGSVDNAGAIGDDGLGIVVDSSGDAYVTGFTPSTNFPTTTGAFQTTLGGSGSFNAFVTKLNASGTALVYSTYLGGNNEDGGSRIALDGSGDVYVTGYTYSTNFPTTTGAFQTTLGGSGISNAFVTKLNASGTALVYSTYLGGNNDDSGNDIAVNGSGDAYVAGYTYSTNFPTTTGAFQTSLGGTQNAFVTELNASGTALVYSTYLGGNDGDSGNGIALDAAGNVYVTGATKSTNFPTTTGAFQTTYGGGYNDGFVAKLALGSFIPNALTASMSSGNLVITDTQGNADNVTVVVDGTNYVITDTLDAFIPGSVPTGTTLSNNNQTLTVPMVLVTSSIQFNLGGGNNTLILDYSGGNFANPIDYNGGGVAGTTDGLVVQGSGTQSATYTPSGTTDGSGTITSAAGSITFSNLTPVDITGMLSLTMAFPNADDVVSIANGTDYLSGGTNAALDVTGTSGGVAFEQAAFWDDTNLVIDTTAVPGTDAVTIASANGVAAGVTNLTVTEPTNQAGTIAVNGAVTFPGSINLTAGQSITANANITGGTGGTTLLADGSGALDTVGVTVQGGAVVSATGNGSVSVTGTGGSGTSGYDYGVEVTGMGSMITSGGGNVVVMGQGGGSGASGDNFGVNLGSGGAVTSGGAGTVTVNGTGGSGSSGDNYGVYLIEAGFPSDGDLEGEITSGGDGAVTVNGTGGSGAGNGNEGVVVGGEITSGAGVVTVTGTGGSGGSDGVDAGVEGPFGELGEITSGGAGTVSVSGTGSGQGDGVAVGGEITSGGVGAVSVTGTGGSGTSGYDYGVEVTGTGSMITSGGGNVVVTGQGGAGATGLFNYGVFLQNLGQILSGGSGTVTVTGTGGSGTNSGDDYGVDVAGGQILSGGSGMVTVTGTGGAGSGGDSVEDLGVIVNGPQSTITSGGGNVEVSGQGGAGVSGGDFGVWVDEGTITSGGTGTVTVNGTGGTTPNGGQYGVFLFGAGSTITSSGGNIVVMGQGSGSDMTEYDTGVASLYGLIQAGGNGTVTVTGHGGPGTTGNEFGVDLADSTITSDGGAIHVTGVAVAGSEAINLKTDASIISGNNAPITITADSLDIDSTSTINSGTGPTNIVPYTTETLIALGGNEVLSGSPLTLGLPTAELAQITAGTLNIGNSSSGAITVSAPITFSSPVVNITTGSGNAIAFTGTGSLTAAGGNVTLTTSGTGAITSTTGATDITVGAGTISLNAGSGGIGTSTSPIIVSGTNLDATTAGNGGEYLNAVGSITIDPTGLTAGTGTVDVDGSGSLPSGQIITVRGPITGGTVSVAAGQSIIVNANITGGTDGTTLLADGSGAMDTVGVTVQGGAVVSATGNGSVSVTGTGGSGTSGYDYGVEVTGTGSMITSGSGNVVVTGQGGAGATGLFNYGVFLQNLGQILSGGSGTVTVTGTGGSGTNSGDDYGVNVAGGQILSGGSGTVTVTGTGGAGSGADSLDGYGVYVNGPQSTITSGGGNVEVIGQGGAGVGGGDFGVLDEGTITSGGNGTVTVTGTGGSGTNGQDYGLYVLGPDATITSGGGNVVVTGQGGGSAASRTNFGVDVQDSCEIQAGGAGTVAVTGTGGPGSNGNDLGLYLSNATITSDGGAIHVTGTGIANSEAVDLTDDASIISGNNAPVTITADSLDIDSTSTINSGTGPTSIVTYTTGTLIALGGNEVLSGSPLTLGLPTAELAQITAGTLNIGNSSSGAITVSVPITFSSPVVNITTGSGNAIAFTGTGSLTLAGGNVTLTTSGTGAITSTTGATDITVGAGTISLNAGSGGIGTSGSPITVSGTNLDATTSGNGNQFLTAVGSITIDPTGLTAGTGTVELDGGTFTLGDNNPINANANLNVNGATFAVGAFSETVNTVTLTSGAISGTTGVLTSTNTFQVQNGTASAILAGANGLTKTTGGTVTLSGENTYVGATTVDGGTLADGVANALPTDTTLTVGSSGTFDLAGYPQQVASLTGSAVITDSGSAATLTVTGGGDFSGTIAGTTRLSTTGSDTLTLSGTNTYSGETTVTSSTLLVTGSLTESAVSVLASGTVSGTGTVQGLSISGDLAPGVDGVGTLMAQGNTTFTSANAEFAVQLDGAEPASSNQLAESGGTVDLGTQTTLVVTQTVPTSLGQSFTIISGAGNITGSFVGLANNATFDNDGIPYRITYSTGSVTLTDIGSALTPPTLPPGDVGLGYNQTITPVTGSPPATLVVSGVTNSTGLVISGSGTGTISVSGIPTATGTVSFTVTPTYANGTGEGNVYSFTVNPAVVITPTSLPTGEVSLGYNQSITTTGGSGAVTLSVSGVTNSTGLTISGSGTGSISLTGTPTAAGTVTFTVTPTDAAGTGAGTVYSFTVAPPVVLTPLTLPVADVGTSYSQMIGATGGTGTVTLSVSGVTNTTGLMITGSGTGTITVSGTPTTTGTVTFTVTPTDTVGTGAGTVYSFVVNPTAVVTPSRLPAGEVGLGYNQSITSTGGSAPVTLSVSGVTNSTGLTISGSGTGSISLTGTPTATGTVSFTVTPTDAVGTGAGTVYSFTVDPAVVLTPITLPVADVGTSYSHMIAATGGTGTVTLSVSGVTNTTGLMITGGGSGTITVSGTPTTTGTVTFTVTPTDTVGTGVGSVYSFEVHSPISLIPGALPVAEVGFVYNQSITPSGGTAPVTLTVSRVTNSSGLTIGGDGTGKITISGTPTTAGTVTFTVTPTDATGTGTGTVYSFAVNPLITLSPATLPAGEVGLGYNQTITSTGGSHPVTLAVSGVTNSTGLTISGSGTGSISVSGTPTSTGTVTFTVTPTDAVGTATGTVYSLTVGAAVVLSLPSLPAGAVGSGYNQVIQASGGTGTVTLSVSGVTNTTGLTISGSGTGTITVSGTPATSGTVTLTVTATDATGTGPGKVYSFVVDPAVTSPPPPPPSLTTQPVLIGGLPNGQAQVYTLNSSTGQYTLSNTLTPFGNIPTDVRTAVGDVNGDGIPDYIFATGPGTPFEVTVLSGAPGNPVLVAPFDPFLPAPPEAQSDLFTAGGFVSAGDFMDNGRDQIVVSPDQAGGPRISIYDMNGAATAAAQPYTAVGVNTAEINPGSGLTRINNFLSVNADFRGGARTAVGDLNGDGVPDLAIAAGYGGGPAVLVINGTKVATTNGFSASDDLIGDFFAFNSSLRDGAYLAIGDVLGNGQEDLILGPGAGGPAEVEVLSGAQIVNDGAIAAIANPVAQFTPTGLGPDGSGTRVAVAATGVGDQVNVVVGAGRNMPGVAKVYPGSGFTSGSTTEPTGGQLLNPYDGVVLTDGIFVG